MWRRIQKTLFARRRLKWSGRNIRKIAKKQSKKQAIYKVFWAHHNSSPNGSYTTINGAIVFSWLCTMCENWFYVTRLDASSVFVGFREGAWAGNQWICCTFCAQHNSSPNKSYTTNKGANVFSWHRRVCENCFCVTKLGVTSVFVGSERRPGRETSEFAVHFVHIATSDLLGLRLHTRARNCSPDSAECAKIVLRLASRCSFRQKTVNATVTPISAHSW